MSASVRVVQDKVRTGSVFRGTQSTGDYWPPEQRVAHPPREHAYLCRCEIDGVEPAEVTDMFVAMEYDRQPAPNQVSLADLSTPPMAAALPDVVAAVVTDGP